MVHPNAQSAHVRPPSVLVHIRAPWHPPLLVKHGFGGNVCEPVLDLHANTSAFSVYHFSGAMFCVLKGDMNATLPTFEVVVMHCGVDKWL